MKEKYCVILSHLSVVRVVLAVVEMMAGGDKLQVFRRVCVCVCVY